MNHFNTTVFGAGIAGLAIANALRKKGQTVLVVDPYVSDHAAGPPAALVNPAMGRHARLSWESEACYTSLRSHLKELIKSSGNTGIISDSGVIRPAVTQELAHNFKDAITQYEWPEGWISWLDRDTVQEFCPFISQNFGGLHLHCGITVYVDNYLNTYRQYVQKNGVSVRYEPAKYHWDSDKNHFEIRNEEHSLGTSDAVIVAAGSYLKEFPDWDKAPIHLVKGQIVVYESEQELPWNIAISAMGYALRRDANKLVVGATYEHTFEDRDITGEAAKLIDKKLKTMLSGIYDQVTPARQMAGVRVSTPNKLPYIGSHPENKKLYLYTGLGSKGFLFSEFVAGILANHICENIPIPDELDVRRDMT